MKTNTFKEEIFSILKAWHPTAVEILVTEHTRCYIFDKDRKKTDVTRDFWYICIELAIRSIEQEESCNQCEQ